jgi:hypothetical protein
MDWSWSILSWALAPLLWAVAVWVWLPTAKAVAEFLVEESRLLRVNSATLERLLLLAKAAGEFENVFFGDGEEECLGYYVVWWGGLYRVYVVVGYHAREPIIEAIDIEEWVSVARAKRLARTR